jgi:glycosyltransferase involved in cell wall biosynthesis
MTRIVFVTDAFAVCGGMERVMADKMNCLVESDEYQVTLVTVNQGEHPLSFYLHHSVRHIDLQVRMHQQYQYHGVKRLLIRRKLKKLLCSRLKEVVADVKPNIIICVKFDFVGVLLKIKGSARLIVESHTLCRAEQIDGSGFLRRMHISLFKKNVAKADAVVALTEGDAKDWRKIHRHVEVIPNVVHLNEGKIASLENKRVIWVGRFDYQKRPLEIIRIWQLVYPQFKDWYLDIYGEGELKTELEAAANSLNMNISIHQPTENIYDAYRNCSVLVNTSLFEPFGLVIPEAMSCGLPVVAYDCPYGPKTIVIDKRTGYLIHENDAISFGVRLSELMDNFSLRIMMKKECLIASRKYSASSIMPVWDSIFKRICS